MAKINFYEIRVEGHLTDRWSDWFDELVIQHDPNSETVIISKFLMRCEERTLSCSTQ